MNRHRGFSLLELIVTVAVAAIVLTVGVAGFREIMQENRLRKYTNEFLTALSLARSEAIKRGVRVSLCKSADGASCTTAHGYEQGWIVFIDPGNPPSATTPIVDPGEAVIQVHGALADGVRLTGNTPVMSYVSYTSEGLSRLLGGGFQAGTLTLCAAPRARAIIINSMGRARVAEATC